MVAIHHTRQQHRHAAEDAEGMRRSPNAPLSAPSEAPSHGRVGKSQDRAKRRKRAHGQREPPQHLILHARPGSLQGALERIDDFRDFHMKGAFRPIDQQHQSQP